MLAERARQLPQGWSISRIAEFATECKQRAGYGDDLPVLSVTKHRGIVRSDQFFKKRVHGKDTSNYKVVHPGQFAYATIHLNEGSIGRLRDSTSGIVSPMYTVFGVHDDIDPDYLFAVLKSTRSLDVYAKITQGTVNRRGGISFRTLSALLLHHPPLPEQRKIAAILSSVDDAIEKTQAVIDQVQVVKRGLMQELLTRGLPGRHTRFKQTEIGEIPEEWYLRPAASVCERIAVGIVIRPAQYYTISGVPCLRSLNVMEDEIAYRDMKYISHESNHQLRKSQLRPGDVVTVRTGYPGKSTVIPPQFDGANCVDLIISTPGPHIRGAFLSRFVNSDRGRAAVAERRGGLAQQHFNVGAMKAMLVPIPGLEEQDEICRVLRSAARRRQSETAFSRSLLSLKSALMSVLLIGEIRVTNADAARPTRPPGRNDLQVGA